jgi:hypothetical protein
MPAEEAPERVLPAERQKPVETTALVQYLEAARMQAQRTHVAGRLAVLLEYEHLNALQTQLSRQHQTGRPTATTITSYCTAESPCHGRGKTVGHDRGLAASPPLR